MNSDTITTPIAEGLPPGENASASASEPGIVSFVRGLKERDDRGALAVLRGALSSSEDRQIRSYRLLAPFGGIPSGDAKQQHNAHVLRVIAGLMTLPNMHIQATGKNFGHSCRKLLQDDERKSLAKPEQPGPVSRRVQHLLAATRDEVLDRVCALARRIANEEGNIDFGRLYDDLRDYRWGTSTKANWAASFWGAGAVEEDANEGGKAE